jgi:non-ribosomal peptide synthetase component F
MELGALMMELGDLPVGDIAQSSQIQSLRAMNLDKADLLASLPTTGEPSTQPLHLLHTLLKDLPGPWPVFSLVKCLTRVYKHLPEDVKTGNDHESALLLRQTSYLVKSSYTSLAQFISPENKPALRASSGGHVITHRELHQFVNNFQLPVDSPGRKPVVSIALPNGPLLAATCIAVTTYYTASPINPAAGPEQFRADILQARANFILTKKEEYTKLQLDSSWVSENNIQVFVIDWIVGEGISVETLDGKSLPVGKVERVSNTADDISLILFTSGTSGTKKVVPLTTHSIVTGVVAVIESWGLTSEDICLNMMPLYHV